MICVLGCGNPNRLDDGVGPAIVRALRARDFPAAPAELKLIDAGTDGMTAMFSARGARSLIVIDACRSGSEPGAVFEVPGAELEREYSPGLNLHDFRWDHALYVGRKIYRENFPTDVTVLLIEAETVELGLGFSTAVTAAAARVADRVEAMIRARLGPAEPAS